MRKEVLTAILVGLFLGLVITYGFYTAKLSTQTADLTSKQEIELAPTSAVENPAAEKLKITSPEDEIIVTDPKIVLTGQTDKSSFVTISLLDLIQVINADETGKFSLEMQLKPGGNLIEIKTSDENGAVSSTTRSIIYDDGVIAAASGSAVVKATPTPPKPSTKPTVKVTPKPTIKP